MARNVGGQPGNKNSAKGKEFFNSLRKVMHDDNNGDYRRGLEALARRLIVSAMSGEAWAMQEIANRFDGKPKQQVELSGDEEHPLISRIERVIIKSEQEQEQEQEQENG